MLKLSWIHFILVWNWIQIRKIQKYCSVLVTWLISPKFPIFTQNQNSIFLLFLYQLGNQYHRKIQYIFMIRNEWIRNSKLVTRTNLSIYLQSSKSFIFLLIIFSCVLIKSTILFNLCLFLRAKLFPIMYFHAFDSTSSASLNSSEYRKKNKYHLYSW